MSIVVPFKGARKVLKRSKKGVFRLGNKFKNGRNTRKGKEHFLLPTAVAKEAKCSFFVFRPPFVLTLKH